MEEYLERAKELKESVVGNYEHSTNIQDEELVDWLIAQAEQLVEIKKLSKEEDLPLATFAIETLIIIEGKDKPTRNRRV